VRFAFIEQHRSRWPVAVACEVLEVSRSGYYAWSERPASPGQERRMRLMEQIQQAHEQSRRTYGSPRIAAELRSRDVPVCENTVAKLMKQAGIRVRPRRSFVPRTTDSAHDYPVPPNRLDRDFGAALPNRKWTCDITYVPTNEGWLYLAVVMDLFSRKIVGWSMQDHLRVELVSDALLMALANRKPAPGLLHHSDRGVQYASEDYQRLLQESGIQCSMSRRGDCYDNAVTESFFSGLKTELVNQQQYATLQEARLSLFEWIETFYNRRRLHSSLGYLSPEAFEARLN
jgi:transposase InsO family protein